MTAVQNSSANNGWATTLLTYHDKGIQLYTQHRKKLMQVLHTVSTVALGIFSLYTNYQLFLPFFFAGVISGAYIQWASTRVKKSQLHEKHAHEHDLHGIKLPPELGVVANIVLTICHIDHHTQFVVPIVGFSVGYQAGQLLEKTFQRILLENKLF